MAMSVLFTTKCSVPRSAWNRVCMCLTVIVEGRRARRREGGEGGGRKEGDSLDDYPLLVPYLSVLYIPDLFAIIAW